MAFKLPQFRAGLGAGATNGSGLTTPMKSLLGNLAESSPRTTPAKGKTPGPSTPSANVTTPKLKKTVKEPPKVKIASSIRGKRIVTGAPAATKISSEVSTHKVASVGGTSSSQRGGKYVSCCPGAVIIPFDDGAALFQHFQEFHPTGAKLVDSES